MGGGVIRLCAAIVDGEAWPLFGCYITHGCGAFFLHSRKTPLF